MTRRNWIGMCAAAVLAAGVLAGCAEGPHTTTEAVYQDGVLVGGRVTRHDGAGGSKVVAEEGYQPENESGEMAIEDGLDNPFEPGSVEMEQPL